MTLLAIYAVPAFAASYFCKDPTSVSAFYLANGVIVTALLVLPRRTGWMFCAACFAINLIQNALTKVDLPHSLLFAALNQAMSFATAFLTRSLCGAATDLSRFRRLAVFAAIALFAAAAEALTGQLICVLIERTSLHFVDEWLRWTGEDALGLLIVTPAALLMLNRRRARYAASAGSMECWLLLVLTVATALIAFSQARSLTFVMVYPLLFMIAFRAGPAWASASVLAVAFIAAAATAHGLGPLAMLAGHESYPAQFVTQVFVVSIFVCAVPATNAVGERNRAVQRLQRAHAVARQARAAAESATLAKSQFLANMSHEIRTPLNGVLGMAQAMAGDALSPVQRQRVEVIRSSGDMLLAILNDVLDLAKIEAAKLELETIPFRLQDIARGAEATFAPMAAKKGLGFAFEVDPEAEGAYRGDPTRIRQIIYNLVSNALKFTERGSVRVSVSPARPGLIIRVADTGVGIPQDRLARLFQKFEQADASTTRRFGGTGLGLAICRELAELMGGAVQAESRLGEGSVFTATLPLERLPDAGAPAPETHDAEALSAIDRPPLRILAADDNPVNRLVLKTLLQQMDLDPVLVDDGKTAVEAWTAEDWDLILMDVQMPVMDGLTATRHIREAERATGRLRTPIIALTADAMSHHVASYTAAGMDVFVAKPIDAAQLLGAIQAALHEADPAPSESGPPGDEQTRPRQRATGAA